MNRVTIFACVFSGQDISKIAILNHANQGSLSLDSMDSNLGGLKGAGEMSHRQTNQSMYRAEGNC